MFGNDTILVHYALNASKGGITNVNTMECNYIVCEKYNIRKKLYFKKVVLYKTN
jgi:hypothetical protein